jgi:hypothetical protein
MVRIALSDFRSLGDKGAKKAVIRQLANDRR